jgi:hypothetical protein
MTAVADQGPEYLSLVKEMLADALQEDRGPGRDDDALDVIADKIMATVKAAGLVLVTEGDFQAMVDGYWRQALHE